VSPFSGRTADDPTRVTLNGVAGRAGVSRTTASLVTTGRTTCAAPQPPRNESNRLRETLEFRPGLFARSLRTHRSRTIGLSDGVATGALPAR
jgi:DNA-binding LacI/PurR family transcriptional regulator